MNVGKPGDISDIEQAVSRLLDPVVNYDSFTIAPAPVDAYSHMVDRLTKRYYAAVTRYGTVGFLKAKLENLD